MESYLQEKNIQLKEQQSEVIDHIMKGKSCTACLPTGYGKSLTFQLISVLKDKVIILYTCFSYLIQHKNDKDIFTI